ncbi:MAG: hypothetical protein EOM16_07775 [Bacteroidia bacterium]|nr:hypothetical protein [Bacteroidia bacterium]
MTRKTTTDNTNNQLQSGGGQEGGGNNTITVREASAMWSAKYPECNVTLQTLRNWAKKFGFGQKRNSILVRSWWEINKAKFEIFLEDPRKFLEPKREAK